MQALLLMCAMELPDVLRRAKVLIAMARPTEQPRSIDPDTTGVDATGAGGAGDGGDGGGASDVPPATSSAAEADGATDTLDVAPHGAPLEAVDDAAGKPELPADDPLEPGFSFSQCTELGAMLVSVSSILGVLRDAPPPRALPRLVARLFEEAHVHKSARLSEAQAVDLLRSSKETQALMTTLKDAKRAALSAAGSAVHLVSLEQDADAGAGEPRRKLLSEMTAAERVEAMNATYVASKTMLEVLDSGETKFDVTELRGLRKQFVELAGSEEGELSRAQFASIMHSRFPALAETESVEVLFDTFDTDDSNTIDFKEFAIGISKRMKGSAVEKLRLVFEAFSEAGEASVNVAELLDVVRKSSAEMAEVAEFTEEVVASLDTRGTGVISRAEFVDALARQPILDDCFRKASTTQGIDTVRVAYLDLSDRHRIAFDAVRRAWSHHLQNGWGDFAEMGLTMFRKFCEAQFKCEQPMMDVLNQLFDCMNKDRRRELPAETLMHGLVQIVDADDDDKTEFFFDMFDRDQSGELDMNEIRAIVLSSQSSANSHARTAVRLLKEIQRIGDGNITFDQFTSYCNKHPALLECFRLLLGVDSDHNPGGREMRKAEIRGLLVEGGSGPYHSRVTARDRAPAGRDTMEGLRRLRKQSLATASGIVTDLQLTAAGLHSGGEGNGSAEPSARDGKADDASGGDDAGGEARAAPKAGAKSTTASAVRAAARAYGDMLSDRMSSSLDDLRKEVVKQRRDTKRRLQDSGPSRASALSSVAKASPRGARGSVSLGKSRGMGSPRLSSPRLADRRKGSFRDLRLDAAATADRLPAVSPLGTASPRPGSSSSGAEVLRPGSAIRGRYGSVATAKSKRLMSPADGGAMRRVSSARVMTRTGSQRSMLGTSPLRERPRSSARPAAADGAPQQAAAASPRLQPMSTSAKDRAAEALAQ